jgi:hypothetical protein
MVRRGGAARDSAQPERRLGGGFSLRPGNDFQLDEPPFDRPREVVLGKPSRPNPADIWKVDRAVGLDPGRPVQVRIFDDPDGDHVRRREHAAPALGRLSPSRREKQTTGYRPESRDTLHCTLSICTGTPGPRPRRFPLRLCNFSRFIPQLGYPGQTHLDSLAFGGLAVIHFTILTGAPTERPRSWSARP